MPTNCQLSNQISKNIESCDDDLEIINQEWGKLPNSELCDFITNSECYSDNNFELKKSIKKEKRRY